MRVKRTTDADQGRAVLSALIATRCSRKGRYSVAKLIEKYGRRGNMMKWREQLNGDCPKRDAHALHGRCGLICPDLPKVL
jgi:hypothetical protein